AERGRRRINQPVGAAGRERTPGQFIARADHNAAGIRLNSHHVPRFAYGHTEPLALADGELFDTVMVAEDFAGGGEDFARPVASVEPRLEKRRVIAARHE